MSAIALEIKLDEITPSLQALDDPRLKTRVLQAAGTVITSLAQRAFDEPQLRPTPWPARKLPAPHPLLIKSGNLRQSIHMQIQGGESVKIGTPVVYGAIHQLGSAKQTGRGSGVPARPYIPIWRDQLTGQAKEMITEAATILIGNAAPR